ncbi:bifunctional (p)ppGpp synthetase/guanosine-3',5'-bis(diphosphate) 3'-pyrophosphohydrolase [Microbacterium sp. JZ70]|uniref:GTP pyrophosphokinase n=2 Tax=Microbacteriaceae TaxID=85023 RepID=A0A9W6H0L1_9MICO|nr:MULTISPECIES: bifunctional (p)ppGpp synthetase/guanosine-3',5'-bis(diphosphate) 3'-pyrophosphohydrolase [Microbacterium]MDI6942046.1 bifunctional (p)ppGpp synthetase/guanosine-3',5'-bis(diphosphate) 3'-pyrophosphohydrolase [Microbacterium barkeri]MDR6875919.1 GTP pyrophosphokinase [Microbacterium barkeri]WRH17550.1 RelA/SpoT family protein [Microbacterium sp. JZ37]GLJ60037.1 GTP pyrophosphokinase [Microbacterium barkeri]
MADSISSPTSLRRLVPRIFSRAPRYADLSKLLTSVRANHPRGDIAIIERAYQVAAEKHRGQKRQSGEPYITHPLAVAEILADLGLGPKAIAAALLHDTVEDTGYPLEDLRAEFGDEVALLVDGVTKLDKVKYGESAQAETVRKMIVAMSKDIRVLVIKLADRLHNARTWGFVPPEKAKKKATETLEIYAPLAHRLGIQAIKSELEDLSFAVLYPKIYNEIDSLVKQRTPQREQYVQRVIDDVSIDLHELRIRGTVVGRPKQLYSVYQKMVVRGREFDDIYDLIGIRVIVSSVRDCYAVLGAIHARWTPLPGRFKDYIATPKFNLYRSLHTTVIGPGGRTVEIQIRTQEMHQQAEYGVAAHWKYKERMASGQVDERLSDTDMAWVARLSDWQAETKDPGEFLDSLRFEIGAKEVYVFTPKGRVIGLPAGATPVDFAYAVHTEIGHRTMGAKVNGRLVPLDSQLNSGDIVEVFTSKNPDAGPSQDWLAFVKSSRARNKIRGWFTKERRDEAIEQGKEAIARAMRRHNMPLQNLKDSLAEVAHQLRLEDVSALYAAVGEGHTSTQSVLEKVTALHQTVEPATGPLDLPATASQRKVHGGDSGVLVRGADDILVKLAKCCTPVPGDEIVGFITRGQGVSVHRADCTNVRALKDNPERMIDVEWAPTTKSVFLVQIQVEALDRAGLLSDITRVLSEHHVNILSANVSTTRERLAISRYVFEMGDTVHLDRVLNAVRRIDGVYDVYRVTSS